MQLSLNHHVGRRVQLRTTLDRIIEIASEEPVESILLVGSMARGEISVYSESDPFDLWSDIDLFIVSQPGGRIDQRRLLSEYRQVALELGMPNPFFHIDFTPLQPGRLDSLPRRISTFEAKQNGGTLFGHDIKAQLPDVTLSNLDYGNTKQLVLIRLTEMLLFIPERIVYQRSNTYEQMIFNYVQVRNALDILTILLPHEGTLLPSYAERNQFIQDNYAQMPSKAYLGQEFPSFLAESLMSKLTLEFNMNSVELYERTLAGYVNLLCFLIGVGPFAGIGELCRALDNSAVKLSNEETRLRQYLADLKFTLRRQMLMRSAIRPTHYKKKMIIFLLLMHTALLADLQGDSKAASTLYQARKLLDLLSMRPVPPFGQAFADEWIGLRDQYLNIFTSVYPAKQARKSYYQQVLKWQYIP